MNQTALSPSDILVRSQETPNPLAIKFITNCSIIADGRATFQNPEECSEIPLARNLFSAGGVKQVYFFENTITITHDETIDLATFEDSIIAIIKSCLPDHRSDFHVTNEKKIRKDNDRSHLSSERQQIEEILDRTIRPGLQADGGDIEVLEFIDNEIKILYQGACGGCPSAMMGTLDAIQSILRHELNNENLVVIPV